MDVAVIPTAGLPHSIFGYAARSAIKALLFNFWMGFKYLLCGTRLARVQDLRHRILLVHGPDEKVDVFRHENVNPDFEFVKLLCPAEVLEKDFGNTRSEQELLPSISAEGEFMGVARVVKALSPTAPASVRTHLG